MGQQQLLLVILVAIIIGMATVVAVNVFGAGVEQANRDAIRNELLTATSHAQRLWLRPVMLEGAGRDFENIADDEALLRRLGIMGEVEDGSSIHNENALYSIASKDASEIVITAVPNLFVEEMQAYICFSSDNSTWHVAIDSPEAQRPEACDS